MRKVLSCLVLASALTGSVAFAADSDLGMTSEAQAIGGGERRVYEGPLQVSPALGVLGFNDSRNNYTSRLTEGLMLNWNVAGMFPVMKTANLGVEVGLMHSHVGSAGSNFIGTNASVENTQGANAFVIPMNITVGAKAGRGYTDVHFGANAIYRSIGSSMLLGRASDGSSGSSTDFFPDVGLTIGWEASRVVGVTLRGDYIPTPNADMFDATLGVTLPLA